MPLEAAAAPDKRATDHPQAAADAASAGTDAHMAATPASTHRPLKRTFSGSDSEAGKRYAPTFTVSQLTSLLPTPKLSALLPSPSAVLSTGATPPSPLTLCPCAPTTLEPPPLSLTPAAAAATTLEVLSTAAAEKSRLDELAREQQLPVSVWQGHARWQLQLRSLLAEADPQSQALLARALSAGPCVTLETLMGLSPEQMSSLPPPVHDLVSRLLTRSTTTANPSTDAGTCRARAPLAGAQP